MVDKKIAPWINKKIVEYIGDTEPMLTQFICKKVRRPSPSLSALPLTGWWVCPFIMTIKNNNTVYIRFNHLE